MITTNCNPETINTINELVTSLTEGERTTFDQIIRSVRLTRNDFEDFSSWSDDSYTRNCIAETEKFEMILICWEKGQITPIHDHGGEECWVNIIDGEFEEVIYQEDESGELKTVKTGNAKTGDFTYMIDFMGFHSLQNVSNSRGMSLHIYAKPIKNCNVYDENLSSFVNRELAYDTVAEQVEN